MGVSCDAVLGAVGAHFGVPCAALLVDAAALPDAAVQSATWVAETGDATLDTLTGERRDVLAAELAELDELATCDPFVRDGLCLTPLSVDGAVVGVIAAWVEEPVLLPADRAVLHILGSQLAVALRNDDLLRRSERLRSEAETHAAELAVDHRQLQEVTERLQHAKQLTRTAIDRLRSAIAALSHDTETDEDLPGMLQRLASVQGSSALDIQVRVEGRPSTLPSALSHALLRIAGDAVINASRHGEADRIIVRLAYRPDRVRLSVADNGTGDPELAAFEAAASPLDLGAAPGQVRQRGRIAYLPSPAWLLRTAALPHGFAEGLRVAEDVDAVWRAVADGWRCRYVPDVVLHHHPRDTVRAALRQRAAYGGGATDLARRHPGGAPPLHVSAWSAIVLLGLLSGRLAGIGRGGSGPGRGRRHVPPDPRRTAAATGGPAGRPRDRFPGPRGAGGPPCGSRPMRRDGCSTTWRTDSACGGAPFVPARRPRCSPAGGAEQR